VCVLDAATAEFSLSSFSDDTCRTQIETLIRQLKPKELIHQKGNLSVATLRMLRNILSIDCQWTALKEGSQFLSAEGTRDNLKELFKPPDTGREDDEMDAEDRVPDAIKTMYDKPIAMEALGGMIWYVSHLAAFAGF
jgi:DNA mismatch repair protein MSH6